MKGNQNANHRGDRQSFYNDIRFDSTWEVGVAKYLDNKKINWKYNVKGFKLSDGRYYYPDFFIYHEDEILMLIEVKGYFMENNKKKFEMFLSEYPSIVIYLFDKSKLIEINIINKSGQCKLN